MNRLTIIMNNDRSLIQDAYSLGVERDNKIDELALITPKEWNGLDMLNSVVSLHLKAESDYFYNAICDNAYIDGNFAVFLFPVTREMTNRNGKVRLEFAFENPAFSFTSRSIELTVSKSLTDGEEIESDYPGVLTDVLNSVERISKKLDDTDSLVATIDSDVDVLFGKAERFDASIGDIEGYFGYRDQEILGLEADFENNTFTRLGAAAGLEAGVDFDSFPMYQRCRCNVADDGTILAYYGDEDYRDDGTNGQVMVYQPAFYYRVVPTKLEKQEGGLGYHIKKANYYISAKPKPFFKLHPAFYDKNGNPVSHIFYSAYEGSVWDASEEGYIISGATIAEDLLCSVAGRRVYTGASHNSQKQLAQNRGEGWYAETVKSYNANLLLMVIEYATFEFQSVIGRGVVDFSNNTTTNRSSYTGSTAFLGNGTGLAKETVNVINDVETTHTEDGKVSISYRGIENVWGNVFKILLGVNYWGDGTMFGGQAYVADDYDFKTSTTNGNYRPVGFTTITAQTVNGRGYIAAFGYGNEEFDWLFLPSLASGTSVLPVGDYSCINPDLNGSNAVYMGGAWGFSTMAGGFCIYPANTYWEPMFGGRLIYVPTAK